MAAFALPGGSEWLIILGIVLLLFGPKNLPKLGKSLGKTIRSVREGVEGKIEDEEDEELPPAKPKSAKATKVSSEDADEE